MGWLEVRAKILEVPGVRTLARSLRSLYDPYHRGLLIARLRFPHQLLQPANETLPNRYPEIFALVCRELAKIEEPRILSYGCSTGEEVISLRRLLPTAQITGADINPDNISLCRARFRSATDPRISFVCCGDPHELPSGNYDAILCLAVLRHAELERLRPESCARVLPFARVEKVVEGLTARLLPGGLLAITNCHFRFVDMDAAGSFETALALPEAIRNNEPLYGPDDCLLTDATCGEVVFRKVAPNSSAARDLN